MRSKERGAKQEEQGVRSEESGIKSDEEGVFQLHTANLELVNFQMSDTSGEKFTSLTIVEFDGSYFNCSFSRRAKPCLSCSP